MRDLTGMVFGRLTVLHEHETSTVRHRKWMCLCECGNSKPVADSALWRGATKSCGCLQKECTSLAKKTHGMTGSPTYICWAMMISRCEYKGNNRYPSYGARGISVCERWRNSFEAFYADMGEKPHKMSIDRIDVDGNYEPSNCRWATASEQAANKRNTIYIEINGERKRLIDWAGGYNNKYKNAHARISKGLTPQMEWFT